MKRLVAALTLAAGLSLSACATTTAPLPVVPHTGQTRALLAAETGIDGVATLVDQALASGALTGANAARAATLLTTLKVMDQAAFTAYAGGDAKGGDGLAAGIVSIVAQLAALVASAKAGG